MEELLNELLERGWKPFGMEYCDKFIIESCGDMCFRWKYPGTDGTHSYDYNFDYFKIRELVSKESGLWQFVCENKIQKERPPYNRDSDTYGFTIQEYQYRIIESALCDEEDLEKFLLENIKIS